MRGRLVALDDHRGRLDHHSLGQAPDACGSREGAQHVGIACTPQCFAARRTQTCECIAELGESIGEVCHESILARGYDIEMPRSHRVFHLWTTPSPPSGPAAGEEVRTPRDAGVGGGA
ncbi:hypothetical protein GCM10025774_34560 [Microbacterium kyungheense]